MKTFPLLLALLPSFASAAPLDQPTYYRDIAPLIGAKCLGCHGADPKGAPFSLATYEDVLGRAEQVADEIASRNMPPVAVNNSGSCQSYTNTSWLTDSEIAMVQDWAGQSAPAGDPATATQVPPPEGVDTLSHVDSVLKMSRPYTPSATDDEIRCFIVDAQGWNDRYLTGFNIVGGKMVHHAILYIPDFWGQWIALWQDIKSPGQGYPCFGSALSTAVPAAVSARGTGAVLLPKDTGVLLPGHRKLILQVHYSPSLLGGATPKPDQTKIELQLEKSVKHSLEVILAGRIGGVTIPPKQEDWTFSRTFQVVPNATQRGTISPFDIYGVLPHMHFYGQKLEAGILRAGATDPTCMMDAFRWDFGHQRNYFYQAPLSLLAGDQFTMTCHYNTMSTDQPVPFGETSKNEMCILGMFVEWRKP